MAFLDNSGDIILDAVLTDTGRMRLAKGDGSFKIAKFVLADDEINYNLYDKNNASGSAYYDLDILQTPIFEAFTNNTSVVKHPLLSISRTNLLYLPVMKLNTQNEETGDVSAGATKFTSLDIFVLTADGTTYSDSYVTGSGVLDGVTPSNNDPIRVDQGIDNTGYPVNYGDVDKLESFYKETQYIIEIDNRLGVICDVNGNEQDASFIDDDNIASYYFTTSDTTLINNITTVDATTSGSDLQFGQVIQGQRGTAITFTIKATTQIQTSTYLFTTLGATDTTTFSPTNVYYIDANVVVRGVTTGSSITIPVRFIKKY
jgi:hypothetical protein